MQNKLKKDKKLCKDCKEFKFFGFSPLCKYCPSDGSCPECGKPIKLVTASIFPYFCYACSLNHRFTLQGKNLWEILFKGI